ncbi:MAG: hypothetical protein ACKOUM_04090, partial [Sphingopyxis sp.]
MALAVVAATGESMADYIGKFRPETSAWRRIAHGGVAAQSALLLLAIATAMVGGVAGGLAGINAALLALALGAWVLLGDYGLKNLPRPRWGYVDAPMGWLVAGAAAPLLGWRGAFGLMAVVAIATLCTAWWPQLWRSGAAHDGSHRDNPDAGGNMPTV